MPFLKLNNPPVHIFETPAPKVTFVELPILIPNMEEPISDEVHVTTEVVDQGTESTNFYSSSPALSLHTTPASVRDFLAKDIILAPYVWSTSTAVNTDITSGGIDVFSQFQGAGINANKLYGMNLIRCKVEFTVKINSNPFQAGRLLVHFLPCVAQYSAGWLATRNINLATKTQQPSIELDCRDTSKTMVIPYVSPFEYYDRLNDIYRIGTFYISVLSGLTVGASDTPNVDVSVNYRFIDVELAAPLVPNADEAVRSAQSHSISRGLRTTARVLKNLGTIPMLSKYVEPIAWAVKVSAGVAATMGYSKPLSDSPPQLMQLEPYKYTATHSGPDMSIPLSGEIDNRLSIAPDVSIRAEDEMSLSFLLSRPYYWKSYTLTPSTATGFYASFQAAPIAMAQSGTYASGVKTATYTTGGPMNYLSRLFNFYRGSIKIRLKFVKTQFHSGRLLFTFSPSYNINNVPTDTTYSLRHYVDIREADDIEFTLPYLIPQTYLTVGESIGLFSIYVQNQLRVPTTCDASMSILVYVSAGDDFELAVPVVGGNLGGLPPLMIGNSDDPTSSTSLVSSVIGGEMKASKTLRPSSLCIGEHFLSVKQLINRYSHVCNTPNSIAYGIPFFHSATTTSAGSITSTAPGGDVLSWVGLMYAFYRGSVRMMPLGVAAGSVVSLARGGSMPYFGPASSFSGGNTVPNRLSTWATPGTVSQTSYGAFVTSQTTTMFKVPYYNTVRCSILDFIVSSSNSGTDPSVPDTALFWANAISADIFRSAGEDYQLSYFIGCPPVLVSLV